MGCVAGSYSGAVCSCRECRNTCPVLNRGCSFTSPCDDCNKDNKEMDKIHNMTVTINLKEMKLEKAKQKALEAIREYRLLLELDKKEKMDELLKELS